MKSYHNFKDKKLFNHQEKKLKRFKVHQLEENFKRQTTIWGNFQAKTTWSSQKWLVVQNKPFLQISEEHNWRCSRTRSNNVRKILLKNASTASCLISRDFLPLLLMPTTLPGCSFKSGVVSHSLSYFKSAYLGNGAF